MGKESQKIDICICITESICCTPETQLCKSTTLQYKINKISLKIWYNKESFTLKKWYV